MTAVRGGDECRHGTYTESVSESDNDVTSSAEIEQDEQMLAEALHAHASLDATEQDLPASTGTAYPPGGSREVPPRTPPLPTRWVLLLVVLLGFASGAVVGLLSLF